MWNDSELLKDNMKCPNCNSLMYFGLDEWGKTPWHLHCDNCDINIGVNNRNKAIELVQIYHKPHTYIEYYNNDIQILFENKKLIIYNERKNE